MTTARSILHVTTASGPIAGAERVLLDLASVAQDHAWEFGVVTVEPWGPLNDALEEKGVLAYSLGTTKSYQAPVAIAKLRSIVKGFNPDVVHTHLFHASALAAAATIGLSPVLVQTRHYEGHTNRFEGRIHQSLDRRIAKRSARLAAVSEPVRDYLVLQEGVDDDLVDVVHNGVDWDALAAVDPEPARRVFDDIGVGDGPLIGCAATYHPCKGHVYLLDAFQAVSERFPDAKLILMGRGTDSPELAAKIAERGIEPNVHCLGFRPDGRHVMAVLDVYTQPSIEEAFGLAVIEAMAMGHPVVVSEVGGMARTVEDGISGFHVKPGDPESLADQLISTLEDPTRSQRVGKNAQRRVKEHFSVGAMAEAYDRFYDRAVEPETR